MALGTPPLQRHFRFESFDVDLRTGELRKSGTKLKIQEQPLKVLAMLLARPGELVTREELHKALWSNGTFVDFERGLNTAVNRLRGVLNDSAEKPRFVETVGKRGYRFIAPVTNGSLGHMEATTERPTSPGGVDEWASNGSECLASASAASLPVAREARATKHWVQVVAIVSAVLIVAVAIVYLRRWWMARGIRPRLENIQMTKLTHHGKAEDVALSPDGRYVAYLFRNGDDTSVRLRQVGEPGETQVLVSSTGSCCGGLAFSPDGNHLYFLRARPKEELFTDLYEIPTLGGPERKVTSNIDTAVSFSPNGRQFAYGTKMNLKDSVDIRIANADGSGDHSLVSIEDAWAGSGPAWSPDGRSIAVSMYMTHKKPPNVLDVISTANGALTELYSGNQVLSRPRWLPDGNMLVLPMTDQGGHKQLWTVSYPAGISRRLSNDLAEYDSIDTTSDGRTMATIQRHTISNLWVSSPSGGSSDKQLTFGEQLIDRVFPLDGKLAIVNRADNGVWVVDSDGAHSRFAGDAVRAFWFTGCANFILFVTDRSGTIELMRTDSDGAKARRLAAGNIFGETCSADGKFVYYVEVLKPRWKIRRVPIDGGTPVDIFENPGVIPGSVAVSPDGKLLAFPYNLGPTGPILKIGIIPAVGGALVKTFDSLAGDIGWLSWSSDGRAVQYLLDKGATNNLWEQPVSGGPPHQLTRFTSGRIFDFNWTADGKRLLLCRGEVTSDVVLLSNLH